MSVSELFSRLRELEARAKELENDINAKEHTGDEEIELRKVRKEQEEIVLQLVS